MQLRKARSLAAMAVAGCAFWVMSAAPAWGFPGDSRTTIFAGSTVLRAGDDSTTGSIVGVGWGLEIQDRVLWNITGSRATTTGERTVVGTDGSTSRVPLSANATTFQTGLTHFFLEGSIVPFTEGGLSVAAYDIDYAYTDSRVGKVKGAGGGAYANLGVELRFGRHFTITPRYQFSFHSIRSDAGNSETLISDGLVLSLRFST